MAQRRMDLSSHRKKKPRRKRSGKAIVEYAGMKLHLHPKGVGVNHEVHGDGEVELFPYVKGLGHTGYSLATLSLLKERGVKASMVLERDGERFTHIGPVVKGTILNIITEETTNDAS